MNYIEELKQHIRIQPCFSCIVRSICTEILFNDDMWIKNPCDKWEDWNDKRDRIITEGKLTFIQYRDSIISSIKEIRRLEKESK